MTPYNKLNADFLLAMSDGNYIIAQKIAIILYTLDKATDICTEIIKRHVKTIPRFKSGGIEYIESGNSEIRINPDASFN